MIAESLGVEDSWVPDGSPDRKTCKVRLTLESSDPGTEEGIASTMANQEMIQYLIDKDMDIIVSELIVQRNVPSLDMVKIQQLFDEIAGENAHVGPLLYTDIYVVDAAVDYIQSGTTISTADVTAIRSVIRKFEGQLTVNSIESNLTNAFASNTELGWVYPLNWVELLGFWKVIKACPDMDFVDLPALIPGQYHYQSKLNLVSQKDLNAAKASIFRFKHNRTISGIIDWR